ARIVRVGRELRRIEVVGAAHEIVRVVNIVQSGRAAADAQASARAVDERALARQQGGAREEGREREGQGRARVAGGETQVQGMEAVDVRRRVVDGAVERHGVRAAVGQGE